MTGTNAPEAKTLRVMFLTLLFITMVGMGVGFVSMFFVASSRHYEWVGRGTSMMLVGFLAATGGLASALVLQKGKLVWLMRTVILLLLATALWWSVFIWIVGDEPLGPLIERLARAGGTLAFAAFGLLFIGQLLAIETQRPAFWWAGRVIAVDIGVFAAAMTMLVWTEWWKPWDDAMAVASIFWGLGTLAAMSVLRTLVRRQKKKPPADSVPSRLRLGLTCPRCGAEQELPTGLVRCGSCRQTLVVEVEEPRCECGYLLFRLEGDRCPECGREIPPAQRWSQAPSAS
jgi:hypothetical protein